MGHKRRYYVGRDSVGSRRKHMGTPSPIIAHTQKTVLGLYEYVGVGSMMYGVLLCCHLMS